MSNPKGSKGKGKGSTVILTDPSTVIGPTAPLTSVIRQTSTLSLPTQTTFSVTNTKSFPIGTTSASTKYTQPPAYTDAASETDTDTSSVASRNILIGVGVAVFLVVLGSIVYFYRQRKGLDDNKSTLKIDGKDNPSKVIPDGTQVMNEGFPRQSPVGYTNNYSDMNYLDTLPAVTYGSSPIHTKSDEYGRLIRNPYQGTVDNYSVLNHADMPMKDYGYGSGMKMESRYIRPPKQLPEVDGSLI